METTSTDNKLVVLIKESGLEPSKSNALIADFGGFFELAAEWKEKADALVITDPEQKEEMKQAKEARLMLRDKRIAVEKKHKELKEASLKEGRALDEIKRTLVGLIEPIEEDLKKKEDFAKIWEENIKLKRRSERLAMLHPYDIHEEAGYDLGNMSEEVWSAFFSGIKKSYEDKKEAERIVAEQRAEKERIDKLHRTRKESAMHLWAWFPDWVKTENLGEITEEKWQETIENAQVAMTKAELEAEKMRKENERLKKENEAKEEKLRKEREKAEAERKKQEEEAKRQREAAEAEQKKKDAERQAQLDAERKKREDAEKELRAKKDEEDRLAREKAEDEKKAALAPEKDKLIKFASLIQVLVPPTMDTPAGKAALAEILKKRDGFVNWIGQEAAKL